MALEDLWGGLDSLWGNWDFGAPQTIDYYDYSIPDLTVGGGDLTYDVSVPDRGLDFTLMDDRTTPSSFMPNADGSSTLVGPNAMRTPTFDMNPRPEPTWWQSVLGIEPEGTVTPLGWRSADGMGIEDAAGNPVLARFPGFDSNLSSGGGSALKRFLDALKSPGSGIGSLDGVGGGGGTSPIGISSPHSPGAATVPSAQTGSLLISSPSLPEFKPMALDTRPARPEPELSPRLRRGLEQLFG